MAGSPWQRFYEWGHRHRRRHWSTRAAILGRPTVSIGNLHWGGSGKTPAVIAVALGLAEQGKRVAVLSRGYRRKGREPLIVSLGEGPLASVEQAGDEPVMLAGQAPGVVVAVGADRRASAALALERAPDIDVFLLDDGFSHVRVRRDVEILTFPASDPFAGGLLLPGGRLREPLGMVRLADAAVITGLERGVEPPADFEPTLRRHGFKGPVFASTLRSELLGGPSPERPLLVTGVARPERVARTAAAAGLECVDHLRFARPPRLPAALPPRDSRRLRTPPLRRGRHDLQGRRQARRPPARGLAAAAGTQGLRRREIEPEFLPWLAGRLER